MYTILSRHAKKNFLNHQHNYGLSSIVATRAAEVKKALGAVMDPVLKQPLLQTGIIRVS